MNQEKVSIVVPVFKVEDCIINILEAVINQTYKNIELILVDDGSPDNSIDIATKFLSDKPITCKIIRQANQGVSIARNNGIKASTGQWIICPDSDDYLTSEAIERMMDAAKKFNSQCVFCNFKNVSINEINLSPQKNRGIKNYKAEYARKLFLERKLMLISPGMLLKRELYESNLYDPKCKYDEDVLIIWKLLYMVTNITYLDVDCYNYYVRKGSTVHTLKPNAYLSASECYKDLEKWILSFNPKDKIVRKIYPKYRLGGLHVLAKSNDYGVFRSTVKEDGYKSNMLQLFLQTNIKLFLYALLFCSSLKLFYKISKKW